MHSSMEFVDVSLKFESVFNLISNPCLNCTNKKLNPIY
jgi:hypothetical protein